MYESSDRLQEAVLTYEEILAVDASGAAPGDARLLRDQAGALRLEEAAWLMSRFYRLWAEEELGKLEALQQARREMIDQRRRQHGAAHPYFWASFILQGNPN